MNINKVASFLAGPINYTDVEKSRVGGRLSENEKFWSNFTFIALSISTLGAYLAAHAVVRGGREFSNCICPVRKAKVKVQDVAKDADKLNPSLKEDLYTNVREALEALQNVPKNNQFHAFYDFENHSYGEKVEGSLTPFDPKVVAYLSERPRSHYGTLTQEDGTPIELKDFILPIVLRDPEDSTKAIHLLLPFALVYDSKDLKLKYNDVVLNIKIQDYDPKSQFEKTSFREAVTSLEERLYSSTPVRYRPSFKNSQKPNVDLLKDLLQKLESLPRTDIKYNVTTHEFSKEEYPLLQESLKVVDWGEVGISTSSDEGVNTQRDFIACEFYPAVEAFISIVDNYLLIWQLYQIQAIGLKRDIFRIIPLEKNSITPDVILNNLDSFKIKNMNSLVFDLKPRLAP